MERKLSEVLTEALFFKRLPGLIQIKRKNERKKNIAAQRSHDHWQLFLRNTGSAKCIDWGRGDSLHRKALKNKT